MRKPEPLPPCSRGAPHDWPSLLTPSFLILLLANLLCVTASSSFMMLPVHLERHGLARWQIGLADACFWSASVLIQPWLVRRLDRQGRKRFFVGGALAMAAAAWGYLATPVNPLHVCVLRAVQGAGFATYVTASWAYLSDRAAPDRIGPFFGVFSLTSLLGGLSGCTVSEQVLAGWGSNALFGTAALVAAAGGMVLGFLSEGAGPIQPPRSTSASCWLPSAARGLVVSAGCFGLAVGAIFAFTAPYLHGLGVTRISALFALLFVVSAVARAGAGLALQRWGPHSLIRPCLVCLGLGCGLLAALPLVLQKIPLFLLSGALTGAGYGAIHPALKAVAVASFEREARGQAISLAKSSIDLGSMAGSLLAGLLATALGYPSMFAAIGTLVITAALISGVDQL